MIQLINQDKRVSPIKMNANAELPALCYTFATHYEEITMVQVSFRIDEETKSEAEHTLEEIGLSMSSALTIFLKKVAREQRIPFELNVDPFYSEENMAHLRAAKARMDTTGGTIHEVNYDD
ncbi:type II toxin-antitoxin system RelB/DinJ family antitoxin [Alloscardovia venturai]|uniref:Type II toxin-antitoxin system RelB/DinJ family antitoxin n=1 Tax=Alloscardovia venturai TaxID=1769421 RepID=A0ABW2Y265_9BIFI